MKEKEKEKEKEKGKRQSKAAAQEEEDPFADVPDAEGGWPSDPQPAKEQSYDDIFDGLTDFDLWLMFGFDGKFFSLDRIYFVSFFVS